MNNYKIVKHYIEKNIVHRFASRHCLIFSVQRATSQKLCNYKMHMNPIFRFFLPNLTKD